MKAPNPFSNVIRDRLAELGLAQIPTPALGYIESKMAHELARVASRKITIRFVSRALLRSVSDAKTTPKSTQNPTVFHNPQG